jgi:diguanylate cyclase (GGDEF)-like protein
MCHSKRCATDAPGRAEILIVEESEQLHGTVSRALRRHGFHCHLVRGALEARRALERSPHDVVLCDAAMSGGSGLEFVTYLRATFPRVAVVMLSTIGEIDLARSALELGVYGWVIKPLDAGQVLIAVTNALIRARLETQSTNYEQRLDNSVRQRTSELEAVVAALELSQDRLRYTADHDELTGLLNRRRFEEELARELARADRYSVRGAVLNLDVDNFKLVNDCFGHAAGDEVLRSVAAALAHRSRASDVVARVGGDEFGVLLRAVGASEARAVADQLLEAVHHALEAVADNPLRLTASIGVAIFEGLCTDRAELLLAADVAMYEAKNRGRDRVVVSMGAHGSLVAGGRAADDSAAHARRY